MRDNAALLTSGSKVYAKKRKAKKEQVEKVEFDPKARRSFLTGFHKRKLERRENAIAQAKAKDREDYLEVRREKREQQKDLLAQRIMENKSYYGINTSDNEREGASVSGSGSDSEDDEADEHNNKRHKGKDVAVLTGETSVTTVTVIKDFDPARLEDEEVDLERKLTPQGLIKKIVDGVVKRSKKNDDDEADSKAASKKPKKKKEKKFRYETKAKRSMKNTKDRAANKDRAIAQRTARGAKDKTTSKRRR
ncbi:hypothetical protein GGI01_001062 [Coemansia sp. RSA 376]|nr:hypothetical protein GGH13_001944 [Coemansia sp. S155-1]KAJ2098725.1 hypothetical protein GGI09_003160 [Coemansia sp. S100]KAJ2112479.1 hypothetical protein IW146_004593 [Coemansia sp. RSA 922]KAJ2263063.1 hypothetical protein GGI01_001062 [Coemansia sp. RSA 376]